MCAYISFFLSVDFSLITVRVSYVGSSTSYISRPNRRSCGFSPYKMVDVSTEHILFCHRIPATSSLQIGLSVTYIYTVAKVN